MWSAVLGSNCTLSTTDARLLGVPVPEEGEEVVGWPERPGVLHSVGGHPVPFLANVHPPREKNLPIKEKNLSMPHTKFVFVSVF